MRWFDRRGFGLGVELGFAPAAGVGLVVAGAVLVVVVAPFVLELDAGIALPVLLPPGDKDPGVGVGVAVGVGN